MNNSTKDIILFLSDIHTNTHTYKFSLSMEGQ